MSYCAKCRGEMPSYMGMDNREWHAKMREALKLAERCAQWVDECDEPKESLALSRALEMLQDLASAVIEVCS